VVVWRFRGRWKKGKSKDLNVVKFKGHVYLNNILELGAETNKGVK